MKASAVTLPRIGPCRCPLHLWFLEFAANRDMVYRRYFANREEARHALRDFKRAAARRVHARHRGEGKQANG